MAAARCCRYRRLPEPFLSRDRSRGGAMKMKWGFSLACLAASVVSTAAFGQASTPRARTAAGTYVAQRGGSYIGIGVVDITADRAKALNMKEERGVEVR